MEELNNTRIAQKQRNFSIILPLHTSKKGLDTNKSTHKQKHKCTQAKHPFNKSVIAHKQEGLRTSVKSGSLAQINFLSKFFRRSVYFNLG